MTKGLALLLGLVAAPSLGSCQTAATTVEGRVTVNHVHGKSSRADNADVVVWLMPLGQDVLPPPPRARHYQMLQKDKQFHPHVLAVSVGAAVEFPNQDPWFHNVFSLYKGEKFDLGLYEAGASRTVRFDRPGVSFLFCNIHPEMSAYVLALETPYFAVSDELGRVKIADVPPGQYRLHVWFERAESAELAKLSREITVGGVTTSLGQIEIQESPLTVPSHPDKYGQPYPVDRTPY